MFSLNQVVAPAKKRGRKRKNDERDDKDDKATTAVAPVTADKSQPLIADIFLKSRRGRPRKNVDTESDLEAKSQSSQKSAEKDGGKSQEACASPKVNESPVALSKITSQLKNTPLVRKYVRNCRFFKRLCEV